MCHVCILQYWHRSSYLPVFIFTVVPCSALRSRDDKNDILDIVLGSRKHFSVISRRATAPMLFITILHFHSSPSHSLLLYSLTHTYHQVTVYITNRTFLSVRSSPVVHRTIFVSASVTSSTETTFDFHLIVVVIVILS
jgi:hypothetical protein